MSRRSKARECALQMLYQWEIARGTTDSVVESYFSMRPAAEKTRGLAERLFRGTLAGRDQIDKRIEGAVVNWRPDRVAAVERSILRLAIYELDQARETPTAVILNEAVELAKRFAEAGSGAFVNGVLDSLQREIRGGTALRTTAGKATRRADAATETDKDE